MVSCLACINHVSQFLADAPPGWNRTWRLKESKICIARTSPFTRSLWVHVPSLPLCTLLLPGRSAVISTRTVTVDRGAYFGALTSSVSQEQI